MHVQSIEHALAETIGEGGVPEAAVKAALARLADPLAKLRRAHEDGSLPLLRLPEKKDDIDALANVAQELAHASDVVFLGTGGSSLGGQTLSQLSGYGTPAVHLRRGARAHFLDNLDPQTLEAVLELPLKTTRFVAISKSGGTAETLMQVMAVIAVLTEKGLKPKDHLVGISEPAKKGGKNGLRALLEEAGAPVLDHDPLIGGRFSALSNVGLLPALVLDLDPHAIRAGAGEALAAILAGRPAEEVPAAIGAALSVAAAASGKPITAMIAYADRLERFTRWWAQLWSESLGKGGKGTTPVAALGPVDQHSQLQLWLDGPRDKLFTVISTRTAGKGPRMEPALAATAGEPELGGRGVGDLVAAETRATTETLAKHGRPVRTIKLERLDERALGGLMMHFMLETILAARLLGVDPFDQPAVEEGKRLAKQHLAR
ncbi:MAG TPA: glucose-6-phosphate isomerase [Xanthobacteraceae bacterium]|nr:glucose-6-phosphate isomerase [Xanthobacteraceae bacterium]